MDPLLKFSLIIRRVQLLLFLLVNFKIWNILRGRKKSETKRHLCWVTGFHVVYYIYIYIKIFLFSCGFWFMKAAPLLSAARQGASLAFFDHWMSCANGPDVLLLRSHRPLDPIDSTSQIARVYLMKCNILDFFLFRVPPLATCSDLAPPVSCPNPNLWPIQFDGFLSFFYSKCSIQS